MIPLVRDGYLAAFDNLGWIYANRTWNGHNLTRALEVFTAAANRGSADAMHSIGSIYFCSIDPPRPQHALPWFERALREGFDRAQASIDAIREGRPCRPE